MPLLLTLGSQVEGGGSSIHDASGGMEMKMNIRKDKRLIIGSKR